MLRRTTYKFGGREDGSVALMMLVVMVVTLLLFAFIVTVEVGLRGSRRAGDSANALQVADAGVNLKFVYLGTGGRVVIGADDMIAARTAIAT